MELVHGNANGQLDIEYAVRDEFADFPL
jgi:hypothetical protein